MKAILFVALSAFFLISCGGNPADSSEGVEAKMATTAPVIDGKNDDACWKNANMYLMDKLWVGKLPHAMDYMGRYKVSWDSAYLYVLAEVFDDSLVDTHPDGLVQYWDDDCLEIFVDEDRRGGNHQYNYSAFAYHISLDGKVVDIGPDSVAHYYNDHGEVAISQKDKLTTWEVKLKLFPATYNDSSVKIPVKLTADKIIGFAIAYNDNDTKPTRESMMGSIEVKPNPDKNRGWIDAGVFGDLKLKQ